jgi:hypothetical protein
MKQCYLSAIKTVDRNAIFEVGWHEGVHTSSAAFFGF